MRVVAFLAGFRGTVFCLDGSPDFAYSVVTNTIDFSNDIKLQNSLICHAVDVMIPNNNTTKTLMEKLNKIDSYEERVKVSVEDFPAMMQGKYSMNFFVKICSICYDRLKAIVNYYQKDATKLKSPIVLLRPKELLANIGQVGDNYGLDALTECSVSVHYLECNHISIIDNKDAADIINKAVIDHSVPKADNKEN